MHSLEDSNSSPPRPASSHDLSFRKPAILFNGMAWIRPQHGGYTTYITQVSDSLHNVSQDCPVLHLSLKMSDMAMSAPFEALSLVSGARHPMHLAQVPRTPLPSAENFKIIWAAFSSSTWLESCKSVGESPWCA